MAKVQTRRSVSLSAWRYAALQRLAAERGQSMAAVVDQLISDAASAKPETVAAKATTSPPGGGPVQWAFSRLEAMLRQRAEQIEAVRASVRRRREKLGVPDTGGSAERDAENAVNLLADLADMVRAAVQP